MRLLCLLSFAAVVMVCSMGSLSAVTDVYWNEPGGGQYQYDPFWVGGMHPGSNDIAVFDLNSLTRYTVTFTDNAQAYGLRVERDTLRLNLAGFEYSLTGELDSPRSIQVSGHGGQMANLEVVGGRLTSFNAGVGGFTDSVGRMRLVGPAMQWQNSRVIEVGREGLGELGIEGGASVTTDDLFAGGNGQGSLWVDDGSSLAVQNKFGVGLMGVGSLSATGGSHLECANAVLGREYDGHGSAILQGTGTRWTIFDSLDVGDNGYGLLDVGGHARLETMRLNLGRSGSGYGHALVGGGGLLNAEKIFVGGCERGSGGQGKLEAAGGGQIVADTLKLWDTGDALRLSGGTVTVRDMWAERGVLDLMDGLLHVRGGSLRLDDHLSLSGDSHADLPTIRLSGGATLNEGDSFDGNLTIGDDNPAAFELLSGSTATVSGEVTLGEEEHGDGRLTVSGYGSALSLRGNLRLGPMGYGELIVNDGGAVVQEVDPRDSKETNIGGSQNGEGRIAVSGAGSSLTLDRLCGYRGEISLADGARMQTTQTRLGEGDASDDIFTARLEGDGTRWTNEETFTMAQSRPATLDILDGAELINGLGLPRDPHHFSISTSNDRRGEVLVAGAGSRLVQHGNLYVAGEPGDETGQGVLTVAAGGELVVDNELVVPSSHSSTRLVVDGGSVTTRSLTLSKPSGLELNDGTVTVDGGLFDIENHNQPLFVSGLDATDLATLRFAGGAATDEQLDLPKLNVGTQTRGRLEVLDGSSIDLDCPLDVAMMYGSEGAIEVSGYGSAIVRTDPEAQFTIGHSGRGELALSDGGRLIDDFESPDDAGRAILGFGGPGEGEVTIDGPGSGWFAKNDIVIGKEADGFVTLRSGAAMTARDIVLGEERNGFGRLDFDGPAIRVSSSRDVVVGYSGVGELVVTGGAQLYSEGGAIGAQSDSSGSALVAGPGSAWTLGGSLGVGGGIFDPGGWGALSVLAEGSVSVGDTLKIHRDGSLVVEGGSVEAASLVAEGIDDETLRFNNGSITVRGGRFTWHGTLSFEGGYVFEHPVMTFAGIEAQESRIEGAIHLGAHGQSTLNVIEGSRIECGSVSLGKTESGHGRLNLNGAGTHLDGSGQGVTVGDNGRGTLNVTGGAMLSTNTATIMRTAEGRGEATVSGSDSLWFNREQFAVGYDGDAGEAGGVLSVSDGGAVINEGGMTIHRRGLLTVNGGSVLTGGLDVSGGRIEMPSGAIVVENEVASVPPGVWGLVVGLAGHAEVEMDDGASVTTHMACLGMNPGAVGRLTVSDSDTEWANTGSVGVGGYGGLPGGEGELEITNGASALIEGTLSMYDGGVVRLSNGRLRAAVVDCEGTLENQSSDSSVAVSKRLRFGPGASYNGGALTWTMTGSDFVNESTSPDDLSALHRATMVFVGGPLTTGSYEVAGHDLGYILEGFSSDNFAMRDLRVGDDDTEGHLRLADLFDNSLQDAEAEPEALYVEQLSVSEGSTLDLNGLNLYVRHTPQIEGTIVESGGAWWHVCDSGDFNGDGALNGLDIPDFKTALGDSANWIAATHRDADVIGDFNGDGVFNGLDIPGFKDALGGSTVPEPATVLLTIASLTAVLKRRR